MAAAVLAQLLLVGLGMLYYLTLIVLGLRVLRHTRPVTSGEDSARWRVYALVPCLNEEQVIGETVRRLLADDRVTVVVIDDGSADRTAEVARGCCPAAVSAGRLRVVRRELPHARQGKGEALNAGYAEVERVITADGLDPGRVLVCVMDADGRLSPSAVDEVTVLFADPRVGGVQLTVRIRNRHSFLGRLQDVEMAGVSSVAQLGRVPFGTVSLGGNGQFARLRALRDMGAAPWSRCLTEDLDLTARMAAAGWRLTSTGAAWVNQQGVVTWRHLLRQRARWAHGHMSCLRHVPRIWRARGLSHVGAIELMLYLLMPWTQLLWSGLLFATTARVTAGLLTGKALGLRLEAVPALAATIGAWYAVSFLPNWIGGYLYLRRQPGTSRIAAVVFGHLLLVAGVVGSVAIWRGLFNLVTRRTAWVKTARVAETAIVRQPVPGAKTTVKT